MNIDEMKFKLACALLPGLMSRRGEDGYTDFAAISEAWSLSHQFFPELAKLRPAKEDQQTQTANIDYTAALHLELMQWNIWEGLVIDESLISKLATRLNSAIKASQNCA